MINETVLSRSLRLMFSGSVALSMGAVALAQAQEAPAPAPIQRVEITGSSIKRAQAEGSLPVQTVTHDDIQKLGVTSTEALLATLTANTMVGATSVAEGVGLQTFGNTTASLRGIGSSKTLVLVNGRRLANYATSGTSVNINSIPLASVDHVEILKDGASGVYGSDAIGGVINFILRNNFNGYEATAYASGTKDGGGKNTKASFIAGWGDFDKDRYNITVSGDVAKDGSLYGAQRSYAGKSWDDAGAFDTSATPSGALRTFDPNTTPDANGRIAKVLNSQGSGIGNALSPGNCAANGSTFDPNFPTCRYNPSPLVPLVPDVKRANLAGSFRFKMSEDQEFFVEGFQSHQLTSVSEQPSPYSVSFLAPDLAFPAANVYPAIVLNPTNPAYPAAYIAANKPSAAGKPVTVSYRAFDGGGRKFQDVADQSHLVVGTKGTFKGYDFDLAYTHNSSSVSENTQQGYQSQLALVKLLSGNDAFNPYVQNQSAALAAQIYATNYVGNMQNAVLRNDSFTGHFGGDVMELPGGTMKFSAGASITDENLNLNPSAAFQTGDISGYGGQALPLSASRSSSAIFGELAMPILKSLEVDFALRTDRYPGITSTNPKVSMRFQPMGEVLFRGSYGQGFREASLPELNDPQTFGTSSTFVDPKTGVSNQWNTLAGGNPNLKPEKSKQFSFGAVVDPAKGVSLAVDYWRINVNQLITTLDPNFIVQQETGGNATYVPLVKRDAAGNITQIVSTNLNVGGLKTAGVDIEAAWKVKTTDMGAFTTRLNGTYITKYDQELPDGTIQPSVGKTIDENGNPLNAVSAGGIIFKWRHTLSFEWKMKDYSFDIAQNFQSSYMDAPRADSATGTDAQKVDSFATYDLGASYTGIKNLTLRAGLKNAFNKKPPLAIGLGNFFQAGYDPTYYDAHGQTGFVTATYKF
jgi:iron complex outermembrane receptor protein